MNIGDFYQKGNMCLTGLFRGDDLSLNATTHEFGRSDDAVRREHSKELFKLFVGIFLITLFPSAERKYNVYRMALCHEFV